MDKSFLLVTWVEENNINMTEQWGTFDELNIDTTYETDDDEERQALRSIEYLRDYGQVGDEFEWCIDPMSGQSGILTRID